eukprot:8960214-Pyramimonas_sp.AAC.1
MVRNVIDDISVQVVGTSPHVVRVLGGVGGQIITGLQRLQLDVSEKNLRSRLLRKGSRRGPLAPGRLRSRGRLRSGV